MTYIYILIAVVVLAIILMFIGHRQIENKILRQRKNIKLLSDYLAKVKEFAEGNFNVYGELNLSADKIQSILGRKGIILNFYEPLTGFLYERYALIVNGIIFLKKELYNRDITTSRIRDMYDIIFATIFQYTGNLEESIKNLEEEKCNIIKLLSRGYLCIISFFYYILESFGFISKETFESWENSRFSKFLSNIGSLLNVIYIILNIILAIRELM